MGGGGPPRTATSGVWIFRASISTRLPRLPKTRAAGSGAGTGSGTLIFLNVSLIFTFQPRTSARAGQRANPERKSRRAGGLTGFAQWRAADTLAVRIRDHPRHGGP